MAKILDINDKTVLDSLLNNAQSNVQTCNSAILNKKGITLNDLKQDPKKASVKAVDVEIKRVKFIRKTSILFSEFFQELSPSLLKKYHDYVISLSPSQLEIFANKKKYALLACFCYVRGIIFVDNLIEILLKLTHRISIKGKERASKEFWNSRRMIYNQNKVLHNVAVITIEKPQGIIEKEIYPKVGKEILEHIATTPLCFDEYYLQRKYHYMLLSYVKHYRRILSPIFSILTFSSSNEKNTKILKAIEIIKKYLDSKLSHYPSGENIPSIIPQRMRKIIIEDGKINKVKYELVLLRTLRTRLRCKDIWVEGCAKYRNPDKDLPRNFEKKKTEYYKELKKTQDAEEFILELKRELSYWLSTFNKNLPKNKKVKIVKKSNKPWIKLSPLTIQKEPENIDQLKQEIF